MHTEITDRESENGWLCFDAECALCRAGVRRFGPWLRRHRFGVVPLQTPWVRERLVLREEALLAEMRLLTGDGRIYGGADALVAIARRIWWVRPLYWGAQVPGIRSALRWGYRWVARRRSCVGGGCNRHSGHVGRSSRRHKRVFFELP